MTDLEGGGKLAPLYHEGVHYALWLRPTPSGLGGGPIRGRNADSREGGKESCFGMSFLGTNYVIEIAESSWHPVRSVRYAVTSYSPRRHSS